MQKVAEILSAKYPQFNTIAPTQTIQDALYKMCCENVDFLIVMDEQRFLGLLTEHDVTNKILFNKKPLSEILVRDFMSSRLPVATVNDSIEYCMQVLERNNHHYLAIFDQFDFKGIVSSYDIIQQILRNRKDVLEKADEREDYSWLY